MASPGGKIGAALVERHPLQRIHSPSRTFSAALHASGLASFAYSFKYIAWISVEKRWSSVKARVLTCTSLVDNPNDINTSYGWHFQYLTIIGLFLATATFSVGFLADIFNSRRLFKAKNALSVCSTPLELLITALYWTLSSIDKRLVLPDFVEETTKQVDFGFHLVPAVVLAIDLLLLSPPWTISALPAMGISAFLSVSYWVWVEACYAHNGFYPYPIFNVSPVFRGLLFLGSAVTMTLNTLLLKWAYGRLNGGWPADARPGDRKY